MVLRKTLYKIALIASSILLPVLAFPEVKEIIAEGTYIDQY
jgi:hypothetical protein